jgi:hypothetical protein
MPAIMIILNAVFITGIVVAIVGLCAWGIVTDRPFATHVSKLAVLRARRFGERRRTPPERSAYRGPNRRVIDVMM